MTVHNEAKKEDIAKTVLMPGDPIRAKVIALKYLKDYKLVNNVRGMYAYTGYYKGKKVTVMASGMGIPSMGIYSYELYKFYDVDNIIRIGTCGSMDEELDIYSLVVASSVYSLSTYAKCYKNDNEIMNCSGYLLDKIKDTANNLNKKITDTRAFSSDTFYCDNDIEDLVNNKKCRVVEMETFGLYFNAIMLNKNAIAIYTVSNNLVTNKETTSNERENSFDDMIVLALEAAISL